jgi:outer membrane biogenesis lipoprotein LolB
MKHPGYRRVIRSYPLLITATLVALLAACASYQPQQQPQQSQQPQQPAKRVNLSGYSTAFKQGYADGCDSAQSARRRDERRYQGDTDYMMGWNDGNSACRRR